MTFLGGTFDQFLGLEQWGPNRPYTIYKGPRPYIGVGPISPPVTDQTSSKDAPKPSQN